MNSQIEKFNEDGIRFGVLNFSDIETGQSNLMIINKTRACANPTFQRISFYDLDKLTQSPITPSTFISSIIRLDDDTRLTPLERMSMNPLKNMQKKFMRSDVYFCPATDTFQITSEHSTVKSISCSIAALESYFINVTGLPRTIVQLKANGLVFELDTYGSTLTWDVSEFSINGYNIPIEDYKSTEEYHTLQDAISQTSRLQGRTITLYN